MNYPLVVHHSRAILPPPNTAEAHSKKRPPRRDSRSISMARRRMRKEPSRNQRPPTPAPQYVPDRAGGIPPLVPPVYPAYGTAPIPQMIAPFVVRGPQICSPLLLDSISWNTILPAVSPYHPLLCTTVHPICTTICFIRTKQ